MVNGDVILRVIENVMPLHSHTGDGELIDMIGRTALTVKLRQEDRAD